LKGRETASFINFFLRLQEFRSAPNVDNPSSVGYESGGSVQKFINVGSKTDLSR
jgi:hypothetical protein